MLKEKVVPKGWIFLFPYPSHFPYTLRVMGLLSIPLILFYFYFFASYYDRHDIYARLFLTQKPGSTIKEPHVFFDEKWIAVLPPIPHVGNLYLPEDLKFPALWVKGWVNGSPVTMRRYPREEAIKIFNRHYASSYAEYVWLSEPIYSNGKEYMSHQIQAEFNVLPDQAHKKIDKFYYIINGDSDQPMYFTFVLDLGQMFGVIPGIGKTTSPYFLQWSYGQFFQLSPPGYRLFGSRAYWQWQNIYHIDQKIQAEWYAWYR